MITERDLQEAIAECEGIRNPTSATCVKLAAYYSLLDRRKPQIETGYSGANQVSIPYSNSYFSQIVERVGIENAYPVIDELMETLYVVNRPLYESVMAKIE